MLSFKNPSRTLRVRRNSTHNRVFYLSKQFTIQWSNFIPWSHQQKAMVDGLVKTASYWTVVRRHTAMNYHWWRVLRLRLTSATSKRSTYRHSSNLVSALSANSLLHLAGARLSVRHCPPLAALLQLVMRRRRACLLMSQTTALLGDKFPASN